MKDVLYKVGGNGRELDPVTPVIEVAEYVSGLGRRHHREIGPEEYSVGDLVLDGNL